MKAVTQTEWACTLVELASAVRLRWPWLTVENSSGEIRVRTDTCSGTLALDVRRGGGEMWLATETKVGSGAALAGDLSLVENGLQEYRAVVDALHFLGTMSAEVAIYPDGECPCDVCAGTGNAGGRDCQFCEGKGKR